MKYHVNNTSDWGAAIIDHTGARHVLKMQEPPFATIEAKDLQSALDIARARYGRNVVVSEPFKVVTETRR